MQLSSILRGLFLCSVIACGGGGGTSTADCVDLCTEAQAGQCTSISGNCSAFCDALDAVDDPAGCADEHAAYESCLEGGSNVCDNNCDAQEADLSNCVGTYCAANSGDPDCQTLINSF